MILSLLNRSEARILVISLFVLVLERLLPWRRAQPFARPELLQDAIWFGINAFALGFLFGDIFSLISGALKTGLTTVFGASATKVRLLAHLPLYLQIPIGLVIIDFVEWCTHYLLHRVPLLWRFHRVHHSIRDMDWIGNFRFHPFEILFYYTTKFIPVMLLGGSRLSAIVIGSIALLIGNLNHANLNLSFGPLRFVLNSPRMHIWHHEARRRGKAGVNFGIVLSVWDWIFHTAYMPTGELPDRLGFEDDEHFPHALWRRMLLPFLDRKQHG